MSAERNYLNYDDSDVWLTDDPMLSSTSYEQKSQDMEPLTPVPPEYLTQLPDTNSSEILDISSVETYSPLTAVFGTPSTSHNNNNSLFCLKSPDVGSPYFSPSPAPSPAVFETTPRVINITSMEQYSDGDTNYVLNYGDGEDFPPAIEMDTDNIPGKHSIINTGLVSA